jgi:ubiquinone/menaquinone biosynthesis C-methylase UbiE
MHASESPDGKRLVAALYDRVAPDYADLGPPLFAHAGRRLVEIAAVAPGDRVLDVATGRGAVLFPRRGTGWSHRAGHRHRSG